MTDSVLTQIRPLSLVALLACALPAGGCEGNTLVVGREGTGIADTEADEGRCSYFGGTDGWPAPDSESICPDVDRSDPATVPALGRLIDDFEGGNGWGLSWEVEDDGTGNAETRPDLERDTIKPHLLRAHPEPLDRWGGPSAKGMHMAGCEHVPGIDSIHWGIKWEYETRGLHDEPDGSPRDSLDLHEYDGLFFWIRLAESSHGEASFLVEFPNADTVPESKGGNGKCEGTPYFCFAHFCKRVTVKDSCWTPVRIELKKDALGNDFGGQLAIDFEKTKMFGIEFVFGNTATKPFDVLIDDLYLYKTNSSP
jgi:hypothetical protein